MGKNTTAYGREMLRQRREKKRKPRNSQVKAVGTCDAKKRAGGSCGLAAGFGTDHFGFGRCKYHGGSAPGGRLNAKKQEAILMGAPKEIDPVAAVIWTIHITAGEVEWLSGQIAQLDRKDWTEDSILGKQMHLFVRERKEAVVRLARFSRDAISLGIAERRVRLAENYGNALARLLKGILEDLQLNEEQKKKAPQIIRKHMILLEATSGGSMLAEQTKPRRELAA